MPFVGKWVNKLWHINTIKITEYMKEARHESGICMPFLSGSPTGKTIVKNFRKVIDFGDENW